MGDSDWPAVLVELQCINAITLTTLLPNGNGNCKDERQRQRQSINPSLLIYYANRTLFDITSCKCTDFSLCKCKIKVPLKERTFLLDQRSKRKMAISSVDVMEIKKIERKIARKLKDTPKIIRKPRQTETVTQDVTLQESDLSDSNSDVKDALEIVKCQSVASSSQSTKACDRTAVLEDLNIVTSVDPSKIIDRSKIRRARKRQRSKYESKSKEFVTCLFFDGRKDKTIAQNMRGNKLHRNTVIEEHIVLVSEPGSKYIGHVTPLSGSAYNIKQGIVKFLEERVDFSNLVAIGCDGTVVNTGNKNGAIRMLELYLDRPVQWLICLFHANELPLRHLMQKLDGPSTGPHGYSELVPNDLSTDQKYLWDICQAVTSGVCSESLIHRKPGKLTHSRWLTAANRILRLYISSNEVTRNLQILTEYVVKVYAPLWFYIKLKPSCKEGPRHLLNMIKWSRHFEEDVLKIIDPVIQRNGFYAHPENILISMVTDESKCIRELVVPFFLQEELGGGKGRWWWKEVELEKQPPPRGTIRENRTSSCPLQSSKVLSKQKRGTFDFKFDESNQIALNLFLLPKDMISKYNKYMGGVDLHDNGVANYRIRVMGKKWWWPLFINTIDSALVNSWKLFNMDELFGRDPLSGAQFSHFDSRNDFIELKLLESKVADVKVNNLNSAPLKISKKKFDDLTSLCKGDTPVDNDNIPFNPIKIFGHEINALLYSGANVSIIGESCLKKLFFLFNLIVNDANVSVSTADGNNQTVLEYIDIIISLNDNRVTPLITVDIDIGDASSIKQRYYPLSPVMQEHMNKEIDKLLTLGVIQPSKSPWSSPILLVKKKSGRCIPITFYCAYQLQQSRFLSSIDLRNDFLQIGLTNYVKHCFYSYCWTVPQGLKISPQVQTRNDKEMFTVTTNQTVLLENRTIVRSPDVVILSAEKYQSKNTEVNPVPSTIKSSDGKIGRTTKKEFEELLHFAQQNKNILNSKLKTTEEDKLNSLWNDLSTRINAKNIGPAKTSSQWKQVEEAGVSALALAAASPPVTAALLRVKLAKEQQHQIRPEDV
ncbi:unnamed protein product [Brassicogethes aeneus]|uniref:PiggyBac transposable element-derived protein domain-containing protein n=1 Tax=Brassicogethes aeneus TaxID=1431903 RepID=A0A9P0BGY0_BRAAE|nr:unnamed protein product [Brassicogethes aeneus]